MQPKVIPSNPMFWPIKALIFLLIDLIARKKGDSLTF
jgi:hypothetical protein